MSKPMSNKAATLLGAVILGFGVFGMLGTTSRIDNAAAVSIIIMCSGMLVIGTWILTVTNLTRRDSRIGERSDT